MALKLVVLFLILLLSHDPRVSLAQQDTFSPDTLPELAVITPENAHQLEQIAVLGSGTLRDLKWSPRGDILAASSTIGVWLYDPVSLNPPQLLTHPAAITDLDFHPDGSLLATSSTDGIVRLWSMDTRAVEQQIQGQPNRYREGTLNPVYAVAFSPDGRTLAFGAESQIRLYDLAQQTERAPIDEVCFYFVLDLAFSPDGSLLACGTSSIAELRGSDGVIGNMNVWDLENEVALLDSGQSPYLLTGRLTFSPDGDLLIGESATFDFFDFGQSEMEVLDIRQQQFLDLDGDDSWWSLLHHPEYDSTGTVIASSSVSGITVWNAEDQTQAAALETAAEVTAKAWNPTNRELAFVSGNRVHVWTTESQSVRSASTHHSPAYDAVRFSQSGALLAAMTGTGEARLWDLDNPIGERLFEESKGMQIQYPSSGLTPDMMVSFNAEESMLAAVSEDGQLATWHFSNLDLTVSRDPIFPYSVKAIHFAENAHLLIIACRGIPGKQVPHDNPLETRLQLEWVEPRSCQDTDRVSLSGDASRFAIATDNPNAISVYDVDSGSLVNSHTNIPGARFGPSQQPTVMSSVLSENGSHLAFFIGASGHGGCCVGSSLQVWSVDGQDEPIELISDGDNTTPEEFPNLAFSPGATLLAAGNTDIGQIGAPVYLWDVSSTQSAPLLAMLNGHTNWVMDVEFSADGTLLASASRDGTIRLWAIPVGE